MMMIVVMLMVMMAPHLFVRDTAYYIEGQHR